VSAQAVRVDLSLRIFPDYHYRDVTPGQDNTVYMEVRNNGDSEVTDIVFEADAPEGWQVSFDPAAIAAMAPGSSRDGSRQLADRRYQCGPTRRGRAG